MSSPSAATPSLTPEQLEAIVGPDVDRGPPLMAAFLTLSIITFFVTAGRLAIRIRSRKLGMEDILALIASVLYIGIAACVSIGAVQMTYRHIQYLTLDQSILALKLNIVEQVLLTSVEVFGKIAIVLMILRIIGGTGNKWDRYFLWTMIACNVIILIIGDILPWCQCQNPEAVWNITLRPETTCWDVSVVANMALGFATWHTVTDFILALYPTYILWDLKISRGRKIAICILLGLGCLTGIFSALKLDQEKALSSIIDVTYEQYYLQIYANLEMFCLLVLASIPIYKNVLDNAGAHIASSKAYSYAKSLISSGSASAHYASSTDTTTKFGGYREQIGDEASQELNTLVGSTTALNNKSKNITQQREFIVESHSVDKIPTS